MANEKIKHQADGKEERFVPTSLDQLWGDTGISKYKTLDSEVYEKTLHEMNKADLQGHSAKLGIRPSDSRDQMIKRLMKEFRAHVASHQKPAPSNDSAKRPSKRVLDILAGGK